MAGMMRRQRLHSALVYYAVGLVLNLCVFPFITHDGAPPVSAAQTTDDPTQADYYACIQTEIDAAIFGSSSGVGAYFLLDEYPTTAVAVSGVGAANRPITFDIVEVVEQPFEGTLVEGLGIRMTVVFGLLIGSGGEIAVSGLIADAPSAEGGRGNFFFPMDTMTTAQYSSMSTARLYRNSIPTSIVNGTPDGAGNPNADPNCSSGTATENCVCNQLRLSAQCRAFAIEVHRTCLNEALIAWAAMMHLCALPLAIPFLGMISAPATVLCMAAATGLWHEAIKACDSALATALKNCHQQLRDGLQKHCGVTIAES